MFAEPTALILYLAAVLLIVAFVRKPRIAITAILTLTIGIVGKIVT